MNANSQPPAPQKIPQPYRGYWKMTAEAGKLPEPYAAYVYELEENPETALLLKDKGISRLLLAKGARIQFEGKQLQLRFEHQKNGSLTLLLKTPEKDRIAGKLLVVEAGIEVLMTDIVLIPKKP